MASSKSYNTVYLGTTNSIWHHEYTKITHFNGMEKMTNVDNYERCLSHVHLSSKWKNLLILVYLFSRQHPLVCCILASVQVYQQITTTAHVLFINTYQHYTTVQWVSCIIYNSTFLDKWEGQYCYSLLLSHLPKQCYYNC